MTSLGIEKTMNIGTRISPIAGLVLALTSISLGLATTQANGPTTTQSSGPIAGIKQVIPWGMLLHAPATQPTCSKFPTSYELGACFQLDDTHCLLVTNLDEQGGPDLCVGNDAFVFEKLSDIRPEKAIIITGMVASLAISTEFDCGAPKLCDRIGIHLDQRRIARACSGGPAVTDDQSRQTLRELGELDRCRRRAAHRGRVEAPGRLGVGGKSIERGCIMKVADGQAGRSRRPLQAERAGSAGGHQKIRARRRAQKPEAGNSLIGHSIDR